MPSSCRSGHPLMPSILPPLNPGRYILQESRGRHQIRFMIRYIFGSLKHISAEWNCMPGLILTG